MEKQKNKAKREHSDKAKKKSLVREEFEYYSKFVLGSCFYMMVICTVYFFFNDLPLARDSFKQLLLWMYGPSAIVLLVANLLTRRPRSRLKYFNSFGITLFVIMAIGLGLIILFTWIVSYLQ